MRCIEVTRETNSGNASNSAFKCSHSRMNAGLWNLRSAERSISSHICFDMRRSRNKKYVSDTSVQNRIIEMMTSSLRSEGCVREQLSHRADEECSSNSS